MTDQQLPEVLGLHLRADRDDGTECGYLPLPSGICTKCGWTPLKQERDDLKAEVTRLRELVCHFAYDVANGEAAGSSYLEACRLMESWGEEVPSLW